MTFLLDRNPGCHSKIGGKRMRGGQSVRQWRIIRAKGVSPNGLTVAEIATREETGVRTINRTVDGGRSGKFALYILTAF